MNGNNKKEEENIGPSYTARRTFVKYENEIISLGIIQLKCFKNVASSPGYSPLYWNMHTHYAIDTLNSRKESDFDLETRKEQKKMYRSHARYLKHNFFAEKSLAQMAYGEILS